jgi:ribosomal protein S18 acetylase RimI-like enzyme
VSFVIRPATVEDARALAQVHVDTWRSAYTGIMPDDALAALDVDEWAERRRGYLVDPGQFHTLVADAGTVIGFVTFGPYRTDGNPDDADPSIGEVLAVYVHPAHQGTGAGRALMDAALAELRARGYREVRLWVLEDNHPSRRFYERYGLATDGQRDIFRLRRPGGLPPADLVEVRYALRIV